MKATMTEFINTGNAVIQLSFSWTEVPGQKEIIDKYADYEIATDAYPRDVLIEMQPHNFRITVLREEYKPMALHFNIDQTEVLMKELTQISTRREKMSLYQFFQEYYY